MKTFNFYTTKHKDFGRLRLTRFDLIAPSLNRTYQLSVYAVTFKGGSPGLLAVLTTIFISSLMESKQICSACRNLTPAAKEGYGNGTLSISFNDARQASITCSFCKYLLQVVLHLLPSLHNWQLSISCEEYENGRRKIYLSVWLRKEGHDIQIRIGIFGIRGKYALHIPKIHLMISSDGMNHCRMAEGHRSSSRPKFFVGRR